MRAFGSCGVCVWIVLAACGDSSRGEPGADGGECPSDCDDGLFCNGVETCSAGSCVAGAAPCDDACNETDDRCGDGCTTDADGDGVRSEDCGGNDCDDADSARFPGNVEQCDLEDRDEDCDPFTFGARDADGDGYPDAACCNGEGEVHCGTDCDDATGAAHPSEAESCDAIDNDCDAAIDELVRADLWPDADGDGYGDGTAPPAPGCPGLVPFTATRAGDCNDAATPINPGAIEACDPAMLDEDCDGVANEDCPCIAGASQPCCSGRGTQTCDMLATGSAWSACSVGGTPEVCNGIDDDCDSLTDETSTDICPGEPSCVSGMCRCPAGETLCGTACEVLGGACDGSDADACAEGSRTCSGGSVVCDDRSGDSGTTTAQCGVDLDCDGDIYELVECDAGSGGGCTPCSLAGTRHATFNTGSHTCGSSCTWGTCNPPRITGVDTGVMLPPFERSGFIGVCPGSVISGRDFAVPYEAGPSSGCEISSIVGLALPAGRYDLSIDNYDSAVLVTPRAYVDVYSNDVFVTSLLVQNVGAGWETHRRTFTLTGCGRVNIRVTAGITLYEGTLYRGGNTVGTLRLNGPY